MFLEKNNYSKTALLNKIVLITGGGGGIGFKASRAFSYMGAKVIIAEIDAIKGTQAQKQINDEYKNFYEHQKVLLQNYEKSAVQLTNDTKLLNNWIDILQKILDVL